MQRVYLAGPITGLNYNEATDWRSNTRKELWKYNIDGLSPMRGKEFLDLPGKIPIQESYNEILQGSSVWINTRDYNDVRRSDGLLVNFLGSTKVSIGTVLEIGFAKALNKPIVIAMERGNIHSHVMIDHGYVVIVPTLEDAINAIVGLIG
jgi:nucleoside 2-deoxyribosyltransferase